ALSLVPFFAVRGVGLPRHPIGIETIKVNLGGAFGPRGATIRRIDADHANAKRRWQEMGSPDYLSPALVAELNGVSECESKPHPFDFQDGHLALEVTLPPLSVAAITFEFAAHGGG
ncbi:MAG: hypothetical protein ABJB10_21960, partial [Mesorhizobium sp.]